MLALKPALHFLPASSFLRRASFLAKLFIYLLPSLYSPRGAIIIPNAQLSPELALHRNGTRASLWVGLRNIERRGKRPYYTAASKELDIGVGHGRRTETQRRQQRAAAASRWYSAFLWRFWLRGMSSRAADCKLGLPRYLEVA